MRYLVLGDVHLGRSLGLGKSINAEEKNSRIVDQLNILDWVIDLCLKEECNRIIITGDVYQDPRPHPAIINYFMRWLKKCEEVSIKVDVVAGNHDIVRSGTFTVSALDLIPELKMDYATFYKNVGWLDIGDHRVLLLPFRDKRMYDVDSSNEGLGKLQEEIVSSGFKFDDRPVNVIGHFAIDGSIPIGDEISDTLHEIFLTEKFLDPFNHVLMGHIHNPQVLNNDEKHHVAHIGSMDRSDFSKLEMGGQKHVVIFDSPYDFRYIEIPTRNLRKVEIEIPSDKDPTDYSINSLYLLDKKESFKDSLVKLEVKLSASAPDLDRNRVNDYLQTNLNAYHICSLIESRMISAIDIDPDKVFESDINIAASIDKFAESRCDFADEDEKNEFKKLAHECRMEYEEALK